MTQYPVVVYITFSRYGDGIVNILTEYYTENISYVKIDNELSEPIKITEDLRQGCSFDHWKKSCQGMGVPITENKFPYSLNYADSQLIITQEADDFEFILKRLNKAYKEWGLAINFNTALNTDQRIHKNT